MFDGAHSVAAFFDARKTQVEEYLALFWTQLKATQETLYYLRSSHSGYAEKDSWIAYLVEIFDSNEKLEFETRNPLTAAKRLATEELIDKARARSLMTHLRQVIGSIYDGFEESPYDMRSFINEGLQNIEKGVRNTTIHSLKCLRVSLFAAFASDSLGNQRYIKE